MGEIKLAKPSKKTSSAARSKKEEIFNAALKVMEKKGYHATRMSDIFDEVDASYGLIYYHFKSKIDLLEAIIDKYFEATFKKVDEITNSDRSPAEKLYQFTLHFFDNYQKKSNLIKIVTSEITRSPSVANTRHLARFLELQSRIQDVIIEGQKQGVFRSDIKARHLTYIFMGSLDAFMSAMVVAKKKIRDNAYKKNITESLYSVFMRGIQIR